MKLYIYNNNVLFKNELNLIEHLAFAEEIDLKLNIGDIKTIYKIITECCNKLRCKSPLHHTVIEEVFKNSEMTFNNICETDKSLKFKFVSLVRGFDRLDTKVIIKNFIIE